MFFFSIRQSTEFYTLSLHDALPICGQLRDRPGAARRRRPAAVRRLAVSSQLVSSQHPAPVRYDLLTRSEEHTSELQSRQYLVCRLLLEKKKNNKQTSTDGSNTDLCK